VGGGSFVVTTHASRAAEVERNQSNLVAHFRAYRASLVDRKQEFFVEPGKSKNGPEHRIVAKQIFCATTNFQKQEQKLSKKSKKKIVRRAYSKADVRELRFHSKARTPVAKISRLTKRTVGSLRQKALKLGIRLGHQR
jgi:hypothetical protein